MAVVVKIRVDLVVEIPLVIRSKTSLRFFASLIFVVFAVVVVNMVVLRIAVFSILVLIIVVLNIVVVIAVVVLVISEIFNVEKSSTNFNASSFSPI